MQFVKLSFHITTVTMFTFRGENVWQGEYVYICLHKKVDRLCGLVVRVPGYRTENNCVSCEVRTEFIYVM
jgi:hypothetical protein